MQITYIKYTPSEIKISPILSAKMDKFINSQDRWHNLDKNKQRAFIGTDYALFGYLRALAEAGDVEAETVIRDIQGCEDNLGQSTTLTKPKDKKAAKSKQNKNANVGTVRSSKNSSK